MTDEMDEVAYDIDRGLAYVDGEFCPIQEAKIWVMDAGIFLGALVFDTLSVYRGYMLKVEAHVDRFFRSMQAVRIQPPTSKDELKELLLETARQSKLRDSLVICYATRGRWSTERLDRWKPTLLITAIPYLSYLSPEGIKTGGKLRISSIRNVPTQCLDARIKTYNRMPSYLAQLEAIDAGANEVVMLDTDGYVAEGRGANIFTVSKGCLYTPQENVLEGITREIVLEMAEREGIKAFQIRMAPYHLYTADEVFLTSSAGGVLPFVEVDGRTVGDGKPGPITKHLRQLYWQVHTDPRYASPVYVTEPMP